MKNPYLDKFNRLPSNDDLNFDVKSYIESWKSRETWIKEYAWAIPDEKSIEIIRKYSPIVEIGAGTGYWGWLITQAGGEFIAYDNEPAEKQWMKVKIGNTLSVAFHPKHSLMLCWPPYDTLMAYQCLNGYKGDTLIYIGEGHGGCTGCDDFHDLVTEKFELVEDHYIPQYRHLHDRLEVFKRK